MLRIQRKLGAKAQWRHGVHGGWPSMGWFRRNPLSSRWWHPILLSSGITTCPFHQAQKPRELRGAGLAMSYHINHLIQETLQLRSP